MALAVSAAAMAGCTTRTVIVVQTPTTTPTASLAPPISSFHRQWCKDVPPVAKDMRSGSVPNQPAATALASDAKHLRTLADEVAAAGYGAEAASVRAFAAAVDALAAKVGADWQHMGSDPSDGLNKALGAIAQAGKPVNALVHPVVAIFGRC